MRTVRVLITAICVSLLGVSEAGAQRVQGLVRDSLTRGGIPGAVLVELDVDGRTLARHLSDAEGRYAFALRTGAHAVRIQRIGFRPQTIEVALLRRRADVAMARLPWFLVPTRVVAKGCSARPDDGIAAALLDQARTGLLAAVVSREQAAAAMVILTFERRLERNGSFDSQRVRIDSGRALRESFTTGPTGADLVEFGFMEDAGDESVLHAPDIDVLLDDAFVRAYCFRLAKPESGRESQVGLSFSPAKRKRDRVDIEGTVWVDTVARALRDIEFRYVGLHRELQAFDPGGRIGLTAMTNGMVLIDRWSLRLVGATLDTVPSPAAIRDPRPVVRNQFHLSESGGELAAARWADGHTYDAALGALRVRAVDATGGPATGLKVRLADTDYRATIDSTGVAAMTRLLPGPYTLIVEDPELAPIGMVLQTGVGFYAYRDSVHTASFDVPTASSYMGERCGNPRMLRGGVVPRILGRVIMSDGGLVEPGEIHLMFEVDRREWEPIEQFFHVESDGLFWICPTYLHKDMEVRVQYRVKKRLVGEIKVALRSDVEIVPLLVDR